VQPIAFCNRCRGMKVGWNERYILHCVACRDWLPKSFRLLILTLLVFASLFAFPLGSEEAPVRIPESQVLGPQVAKASLAPAPKHRQTVATIEALLLRNKAEKGWVSRVAKAVVESSARYKLDPRLVASIAIIESRANPFAVSTSDAVGIMQIHLGTWAALADQENINLFDIEDNVEFGARILRDYIAGNGLWEGVARYKGVTDAPESRQSADDYVQKVQNIYGITPVRASLD
jgi:soluble lytic murein transglycosylase-like protein